MTDYFEIHEHDGPARLGELRLEKSITTPALVGDMLSDSGSMWTDERDFDEVEGDRSSVTVMPHRAMPAGTPDEVVEKLTPKTPEMDFPSASVVNVDNPVASGQDMYILTGLREGHARHIVSRIMDARRVLEPDSALMIPRTATPRNVSLLAYLGIDAFDEDRAAVKGYGGVYMTRELELDVDEIDELPCACSVCFDKDSDGLARDEVAEHNVKILRSELANIRDKIRNGRLREYIEGQVRSKRWLVEAMRLVDQEKKYVERHTPVVRRTKLDANSSEALDRIEIRRFAQRVVERYRAPRSDVAVLLPCSAKKPYSESKSHSDFRNAIRGRAHEVIVTSPLGVVPRELEYTYPAGHYDTPVTGRWDAKEHEFVSDVFEEYMENNPYDRVVAHLPHEGYGDVVESVTEEKGIEVEFTVQSDGHPRDDDALERLDETLNGMDQAPFSMKKKWTIRGICDYQFGRGEFDDSFSLSDIEVTGRSPKLRVFERSEDRQVATLVPDYGTLALTLDGVDRFNPPRVEIGDFVPHGNVLAPGVLTADEHLRVGDEVVFEGKSALGVGRAKMFGKEMVRSQRGVAIDVRHVEEKED